MFAAGPLSQEDGTRYGGMFVLRANSFEEARAIADADPLHKAGLRSYTLMRWTVNEGSYSVRVNYSDQRRHDRIDASVDSSKALVDYHIWTRALAT